MTTTQTDRLMDLADTYSGARAAWHVENLYGTSKRYTEQLYKEMEEARSALLAALQAREQQWLPIESAPKDGTSVLLYFPHKDLVIRGVWEWQGEGDWESGQQDWKDWCTDNDVVVQEDPSYAPTHWQPLPPPPASPQEQQP